MTQTGPDPQGTLGLHPQSSLPGVSKGCGSQWGRGLSPTTDAPQGPRDLATQLSTCPSTRAYLFSHTNSESFTLSYPISNTPSRVPLPPPYPAACPQAAQWSARPLSSSPHLGPRSSRLPETALEAFDPRLGSHISLPTTPAGCHCAVTLAGPGGGPWGTEVQSPGTRSLWAGHRALGRHPQPRLPPPSPPRAHPGARGQAEPQALVWAGVARRLACLWGALSEPGSQGPSGAWGAGGAPAPGSQWTGWRSPGAGTQGPALVTAPPGPCRWRRRLCSLRGSEANVREWGRPWGSGASPPLARAALWPPEPPGQVRACERALCPL